jgi:hypothetical protein
MTPPLTKINSRAAKPERTWELEKENSAKTLQQDGLARPHQNLMLLSPWRPQTTMAIEKVKTAARDAQPAVINMARSSVVDATLPSVVAAR